VGTVIGGSAFFCGLCPHPPGDFAPACWMQHTTTTLITLGCSAEIAMRFPLLGVFGDGVHRGLGRRLSRSSSREHVGGEQPRSTPANIPSKTTLTGPHAPKTTTAPRPQSARGGSYVPDACASGTLSRRPCVTDLQGRSDRHHANEVVRKCRQTGEGRRGDHNRCAAFNDEAILDPRRGRAVEVVINE
jgi:hypothetical protein